MANSNYGGFDAGNAWAKNAAFAIEKSFSKKWTHAQAQNHPLLAILKQRGLNWNVNSIGGRSFVLPVVLTGPTTAAAGVADADELTPMTYNSTTGMTQAEFQYAHYVGNLTIRDSERKLLSGPEGTARGNILEGKTKQLVESFMTVIQGHLSGSAADSRTQVLGILQPLSTSNTVGGISQTADTNFRANVTTSVGTLTLPIIDAMHDTITNYNTAPDLAICAAPASGVNIYGKVRQLVASSVVYNDPENELVKAGVSSFSYLGMKFVKDHRMATGNLAVLNTDTWHFAGETDMPVLDHNEPIPNTDARELVYKWWISLGINNPKANGLLSGITG